MGCGRTILGVHNELSYDVHARVALLPLLRCCCSCCWWCCCCCWWWWRHALNHEDLLGGKHFGNRCRKEACHVLWLSQPWPHKCFIVVQCWKNTPAIGSTVLLLGISCGLRLPIVLQNTASCPQLSRFAVVKTTKKQVPFVKVCSKTLHINTSLISSNLAWV